MQRIALADPPWTPVAESQLAGNALSKIAPAGGAVGGALQYRMLVERGVDRARAATGVTAVNLLTFAVVLALPVLAIPTFLRGAVDRNLVEATLIGVVVFVLLLVVAIALLAFDKPLRWLGERIQAIRNRLRRHSEPLRHLPDRLRRERDRLLATLGPRWKLALAATVGRWAFDYLTLLAALAAVGSTPRPALVLLAFCAAQVLAQVPVTPGRVGLRRGRAHRHARVGRGWGGRRGARDAGLSPVLLLVAVAGGFRRLRTPPQEARARGGVSATPPDRRSTPIRA